MSHLFDPLSVMNSALLLITNSIVPILGAVLLIAVLMRHRSWRTTLARLVCIVALYGLIQTFRFLDESGYGLRAIGSDFSSHTASAFALSLIIFYLLPASLWVMVAINLVYWALMLYFGFHSAGHIGMTLLLFAPVSVGLTLLLDRGLHARLRKTPDRA